MGLRYIYLWKASKVTNRILYTEKFKQNIKLVLNIFHKSIIVAIRSYFPENEDATRFLPFFNVWLIISNSNKKYNCSGPQAFKNQRVGYQSDPKLLQHNQYSQNQLNSSDTAYLRVSWTKRPQPFLTRPTQKSLNQLLVFLNLCQQTKNQFIPSVHFRDTVNSRVLWQDWPHPFLTIPTQ